MHSPFRLIFPLIVHSGVGASIADAADDKMDWASVGTLTAPKMIVFLVRPRQSQGEMNAPLQSPALTWRAAASSESYSVRIADE